MSSPVEFDNGDPLRSTVLRPTKEIFDLLFFFKNIYGAYERKWGPLAVSAALWIGGWHMICDWKYPRRAALFQVRLPSRTSPAEFLSALYLMCKDAFGPTDTLPHEFEIGREYAKYLQKTRELPPHLPIRCTNVMLATELHNRKRIIERWRRSENEYVAWVDAHPRPKLEWVETANRLREMHRREDANRGT